MRTAYPTVLDYLAKYVAEPELLSHTDAAALDPAVLPISWRALMREEGHERCQRALAEWQPFKSAFEQTLDYLRSHLLSVDLLKTRRGYTACSTVSKPKKPAIRSTTRRATR